MPIAPNSFVHLHLHSDYSLLDGANRIDRLIARLKELGMDAAAVTDHGNLFGAVEFYTKAKAAGIKPILGIEAYIASDINGQNGDRKQRNYTGASDGGFHLVLLAENITGWRNLLKLSSDAYINGFYYKPRMDKSTLTEHSEGLIAINGHLGSSLAHYLTRYENSKDDKDFQAALKEATWHRDLFGQNKTGQPNFYIELQRHDVPEQLAINPHLQRLAQTLNLPLVCDNDAHFLLEEDYDAHDTLCCISMGKIKQEPNRLHYPKQLYVKSAQQMSELFEDIPQAIENTRLIADRCDVELDFSQNHAPVVKIQKREHTADAKDSSVAVGSTQWYQNFCSDYDLHPFDQMHDDTSPQQLKEECDKALRELAQAGLLWRYGQEGITDAIRARLDRELTVIADKGISAYFLIVWDFVNEARRRAIPVNARGSAVGVMVGYCLGVSNACPVKYNLLFERFTDPDRNEYPDIDIDMCQDGRQALIEYVRQKYGHVAQIITFGTLKARAAIRDVGRVLDVPLPEVDKLCKLVGSGLSMTLQKALDQEPQLKQLYDDNPIIRTLIDTAQRLEGLARHAGVHAAGIVIATQPLDNLIPLYQPAGTQQLVTQWDGPTIDKIGLLKMDFLGLRTLSIIERAKKLIGQTLRGAMPDFDHLDYEDQKVFDLFRRGETAGVFQFESGGMRNTLIGMKPDRLEDLFAANALFRPGPMQLIPDYIDRKQGRAVVPKVHPIVDRFTEETYGIMVYQEQVMQIVHELGDIPLGAAYKLIKAISKKKRKTIDAVRPKFIQGAGEKGVSNEQASELFELILKFAGYGFNKSHSTGYAIVAYQTAYLKTYFPVQYMAALLTYESVSTDKVVEYIGECRRVLLPDGRRGIEVRPPDINLCDVAFTVVYEKDEPRDASHGHIRFGLSAVKGVGEKAIESIDGARQKDGPFKSLHDFCERVSLQAVNRATTEALIKCGAFDAVHHADQRAAMVEALDDAIQSGQRAASDRDAGQLSFFESFDQADEAQSQKQEAPLPKVTPWSDAQMLKHEKSVLGFFVSSHPLDAHRQLMATFASGTVEEIKQLAGDVPVVIGAMVTRVRPTVVKNGRSAGQKMAMITVEDHTGSIDGVTFSDAYAIAAPLLVPDAVVMLKGKIDRRREEPSIIVDAVIAPEHVPGQLTEQVRIILKMGDEHGGHGARLINGELDTLKELLRQSAGVNGSRAADVVIEVHQDHCVALLKLNAMRVKVDADLPQRIETVLHTSDCCRLIGPRKHAMDHSSQDQTQPRPQRLVHSAPEEALCPSLDRY